MVPFVAMASKLSYWAVEEKDQQEPHYPWSLTSVTLLSFLQSKLIGEANKPEEDNGEGEESGFFARWGR